MEVWIWRGIGLLGQGLFFSRFLVQWIASERRKESVIPHYFWYLSLSGGIILFFYAMHIRDPIFILGQSCGVFVYTRNLVLIFRKKKIKGMD
ncbi:MAG: lipid-A-disaccharide synthase N-terminal domain-containing protein [Thermodesulfobacteriota bacterium]|jgi:lipid-A-disaccharide synthase-like uncharacterized protein